MVPRARMFPLQLLLATPLAGQEQRGSPEEPRVTVRGTVVDGIRGDPLPNAMIRLVEARRGVLADSLGRFALVDVRPGSYTLAVKQYGYEEIDVDLEVTAGRSPLRIELTPDAVALQGFDVVADRLATMTQRLQSRRDAAPVSVRALGQDRLARSTARDASELLEYEAFLKPVDCPRRSILATGCILRRGQSFAPRVFIDEAPTIGGLDNLGTYRPYELYMIEVYSSGAEIHAYTHNFMERAARRPFALIPVFLP